MKDLCKKLTASLMCFSFLSLQVTFAGQFDSTTVLPDTGLGGADIHDHTDGLTGINGAGSNKADLTFGKDTVINWGHLNVGNGQQLNFLNGNYAVLNNVLQGMSTFAGSLTGQNGMIIIANPNGMLMNGGSIETSGALILTTQDLYAKYDQYVNKNGVFDKNVLQDLLKDPQFKNNTYSIISINNQLGGKVSGADINIIAKGIDLNNANITSTGDIAFTTSDGANFVAAAKDPNNTNGIKFNDGTSIQIANSSIKANDGSENITLIAGKGNDQTNVTVDGSTLTGNTNVKGEVVTFNAGKNSNTTVNGNLNVTSNNRTGLFNTKVGGDVTVNSGDIAYYNNLTATNLNNTSKSYTNLMNSNISEKVTSNSGEKVVQGPSNPYASFYMGNSSVGELDITTKQGAIQLEGGSVTGNAKLTANTTGSNNNGNIIIGYKNQDFNNNMDDQKNSTSIGGDITANTTSWLKAYSEKDLNFTNSDIGLDFYAESNTGSVNLTGGSIHGDAILDAAKLATINNGSDKTTNIDGNLNITSGNRTGLFNTNVGGDVTVDSGDIAYYNNLTATNLNNTSNSYTNLMNSNISGKVTSNSGEKVVQGPSNPYASFYMGNSSVGELDITTKQGAIQLEGGSVTGNAKLTANTTGSNNNGNIIIGYKNQDFNNNMDDQKNSTSIGGDITANTTSWLKAYSEKDLNFTNSDIGLDFYAESNTGSVNLTGGSIHGNAILDAATLATINNGSSETTTIDGNLNIISGNRTGLFNTKVGGDVTVNSGDIAYYNNLTATNLNNTSNSYTNLMNSNISGKVTSTSGDKVVQGPSNPYASFYMGDSNVGSLDVTTKQGAIQLSGGSVNGDAKLTANTENSNNNGNIIIGYKNQNFNDMDNEKNSTVISGNITANTGSWVKAYSDGDLSFKDSNVGLDFDAESANGKISINTTDIGGNTTVEANKGITIWNTNIDKNLDATFTGDKSVGHPADRPTDPAHDIYLYNTNVKGDAKLTAVNAQDGAITISNSTVEGNATATAGDKVSLWQSTVGKKFTGTSKNGDVYISALDGARRSEVGSAELNAGRNAYLVNSDVKDSLVMNAENGSIYSSDSTVGGFAEMNAKNGNISSNGTDYAKSVKANTNNATFNTNKSIQLHSSDIKQKLTVATKNDDATISVSHSTVGSADLTSNGHIGFDYSTSNGDLKATSKNDQFDAYKSEINGTAIINADKGTDLVQTKLQDAYITTPNGRTNLSDVTANRVDIDAQDVLFARSEINGRTDVDADNDILVDRTNFNGENNAIRLAAGNQVYSANSSYDGIIYVTAKNATFKDSTGDLRFFDANVDGKLAANTDGNISLDSNANGVDESLMSKVGSLDFRTEDGDIKVWDTNVTSDATLTSNGGNILLSDSKVGNKANLSTTNFGTINVSRINAKDLETTAHHGATNISNSEVNNIKSTADRDDGTITLSNNVKADNATLSAKGGKIQVSGSTIKNVTASNKGYGEVNVYRSNIETLNATTNHGDIKIDAEPNAKNEIGTLNATSTNGNVKIWDTNVKNNANLNAKNGDVTSDNTNYGGTITVNAVNGTFNSNSHLNFNNSNVTNALKATTDGKVALNNSKVGGKFTGKSNAYEVAVNNSNVGSADLTSKWNNSFNNSTSNGDVNMTSTDGNATINNSTVKGSADVNAKGNAAINGSTVDKDATVHATNGKASIWNSIVGGKATVTSDNFEAAIGASEGKTSQVGSAEINSKYNNRLYNTVVNGDAKMTSTNGHSTMSNATVNGSAEVNAKGNAAINGSTVTGDANVHAQDGKAQVWNSTVDGKATVTSDNYEAAIGASEGQTSQVGSAEINSKFNNRLYNTTVNGDANMNSTNGNSSMSNATVNGNANLNAKGSAAISGSNITGNANVNAEEGKASIYASTVNGKATVKSSKNEAAIGESKVGSTDMYGETGARFYNSTSDSELKIKANTGDVNITNAKVRNVNATSHKANINVKDTETTGTSRNHFTAKNGNVNSTNSLYLGDIKVSSKNANFDSSNKGSLNFVDSTITENLNAKAHGKVGVLNSTVGNKLTAESLQSEVGITSSQVGSVDAKAKYNVRFNKSTSQGDANLESAVGGAVTVNGSTIGGDANVKANGKTNKANVNITNTNVTGNLNAEANNDVNIKHSNAAFIDADAGHDVNLETTGDMTINNNSNFELTGGHAVNIKTDGNMTVDNLTDNSKLNAPNIGLDAANITSNNSNYNGNVNMTSGDDVTFTGVNDINGDLTISASREHGFVALNGDKTTADNITVNNAQWIEARNVDTGHIEFNNFEIGHIIESDIDSTAFSDGDSVYIHRLNTTINGQELDPFKQIITDSATNVNQVIFYPYSPVNPGGGGDNPGGGTIGGGGDGFGGGTLDQDAVKLMNYLRDKGVDVRIGSDFAPIAFAAHEGRRGGKYLMNIGDSVYRALEQHLDTLNIADRFDVNP